MQHLNNIKKLLKFRKSISGWVKSKYACGNDEKMESFVYIEIDSFRISDIKFPFA